MLSTKDYIRLYNSSCSNDPQVRYALNEYNNELLKKYPFLRLSDEYPTNLTWADYMEDGWRIAFGEQMFDEIKEELIRINCLYDYRIIDIKEKFGELRWYDTGYPTEPKLQSIIDKYNKISKTTCIKCGKPAKYIAMGWITPYCEDCIPEVLKKSAKEIETQT